MTDPRPTPVIATARLRLRARTPDDAEALYPMLSDAAAMTWWAHPPHTDVAQTGARLAQVLPGRRDWTIVLTDGGTVIGMASAGEKWSGKVTEIGYLIGRPWWRQGYAREAVSALVDHLFAVDGQRRLFADTDPDNAASRALLERLGFSLEGVLREEWETHIGVRDTALYALLRREWEAAGADGSRPRPT